MLYHRMHNFYNVKITYDAVNGKMYKRREIIHSTYISKLQPLTSSMHTQTSPVKLYISCTCVFNFCQYIVDIILKAAFTVHTVKVGSSSHKSIFCIIYKEGYIVILFQKYISSHQFPKSLFHILVPQTINDGVQHRAYKSVENSNNFRLLH